MLRNVVLLHLVLLHVIITFTTPPTGSQPASQLSSPPTGCNFIRHHPPPWPVSRQQVIRHSFSMDWEVGVHYTSLTHSAIPFHSVSFYSHTHPQLDCSCYLCGCSRCPCCCCCCWLGMLPSSPFYGRSSGDVCRNLNKIIWKFINFTTALMDNLFALKLLVILHWD